MDKFCSAPTLSNFRALSIKTQRMFYDESARSQRDNIGDIHLAKTVLGFQPKVIVIGGGIDNDVEYAEIDPHFITIGSHRGPMKGEDWNSPRYFADAFDRLAPLQSTIRCIIFDSGSESWLRGINIEEAVKFIRLMLADDGIIIMNSMIEQNPDRSYSFLEDTMAYKLIRKLVLYLKGIFYIGDPNDPYFEINDIYSIYSQKPVPGFSTTGYSTDEDILVMLRHEILRRKVKEKGKPYVEAVRKLIYS